MMKSYQRMRGRGTEQPRSTDADGVAVARHTSASVGHAMAMHAVLRETERNSFLRISCSWPCLGSIV